MQGARTEPRQEEAGTQGHWIRIAALRYSVPVIYLVVALPVALLLCYLVPPNQPADEGRHFLRACQIAEGQILPQIDSTTQEAGGFLPAAVVDFVRDKMDPKYYRNEDRLHTIGARLRALDLAAQRQRPLSEKEFGMFPGSALYPPALYLPQAAGVLLARAFSDKVYIWFYAARVANAVMAVLLIFLALLLTPGYRLLLLIPAILPMSLYQISSVSCDAGIISVSILFAALCIRFFSADGWLIRAALVACLALLTLAKPVYLPFALLLIPAYKRLGWRRAIQFCVAAIVISAGAYLTWSYLVRPIFPMASVGWQGRNPSAQVHFILAHPTGFVIVLLHTLKWDARGLIPEMIGIFGWVAIEIPSWFYRVTYAFFACVFILMALQSRRAEFSKLLWGSVAVVSMLISIPLALFVIASPVGATHVEGLQGRYFIPLLALLPFFVPPLKRFTRRPRFALAFLTLSFFSVSVFTTVRILDHYYFPESKLVGDDIHSRFREVSSQSCPASIQVKYTSGYFSVIERGQADVPGEFRVLITDENGIILGESDPALAGADFPYNLLPGSSHSKWFVHIWRLNGFATLHSWLIRGNTACKFGSALKLEPYSIPSA
ncbi:MAG: DUF2142 domain-containing protein [Terriglobia bacterium]